MSTLRIQRTDYAILFLILVIAIVARVIDLSSSLWHDEIATMIHYIRPSVWEILTVNPSFNNHIFYSLQAKASVIIFGESNWSVRVPAVLFGIASILIMWRLSVSVFGVCQAHVVASLMALSYHHVWFSQNARGYTEMMFWCILSILALMACIRDPSWKRWFLYSLIVVAGLYTHLTAGIFFFAQAIYIFGIVIYKLNVRTADANDALKKEDWVMPLVSFISAGFLILLLYAPVLSSLVDSVLSVPETSAVDVMKEYQSPIWAVLEIMRSFLSPGPVFLTVGAATATLILIGARSSFKTEPMVAVVFVLHIILLLVVLLSLSMRIWPRFFFIDMGFILLFIVQGVFVCCQKISFVIKKYASIDLSGRKLFVVSAIMMVAIFCFLLPKNYKNPKQDFDASFRYIEENRQPSDNVTVLGVSAELFNTYYDAKWTVIESIEALKEIESNGTTTWLLITFPNRTSRTYESIMKHLGETFSTEKIFRGTLGDGNILIYKSDVKK